MAGLPHLEEMKVIAYSAEMQVTLHLRFIKFTALLFCEMIGPRLLVLRVVSVVFHG